MISVLVADDQELVRLGLRTLIENEDDLEFAGEAADGLAAVARVRETRPDVVLMDIRMPGVDGLEATRRITADPALTGTLDREALDELTERVIADTIVELGRGSAVVVVAHRPAIVELADRVLALPAPPEAPAPAPRTVRPRRTAPPRG